jgi:hypothetical protein
METSDNQPTPPMPLGDVYSVATIKDDSGPKLRAYKEQIEPTLIKIAQLCRENGIQMQSFFGLDLDENGKLIIGGYCTAMPKSHAFTCTLGGGWHGTERVAVDAAKGMATEK